MEFMQCRRSSDSIVGIEIANAAVSPEIEVTAHECEDRSAKQTHTHRDGGDTNGEAELTTPEPKIVTMMMAKACEESRS